MKSSKFAILALLVLVICTNSLAVNTRQIDLVRKKDVLQPSDNQVIRDFLQSGVAEISNTEDFTTISQTRQAIVSRSKSSNDNSAIQYEKAFNSAAVSVLNDAFSTLPAENREKIQINLLLLVKELQNAALADLAMQYFDAANPAIQYLAVGCVTTDEMLKALNTNTSDRVELAERVLAKFSEMTTASLDNNVLSNIVKAANAIDTDSARELLLKIARMRMEKYTSWQVKNASVDKELITALGEKAQKALEDVEKIELIAAMAQLYSYTIQTYANSDDLSDNFKEQLIDVIVSVENGIISDMLGNKTQNLKKSIEKRDMSGLISGHDSLLGNSVSKGMLANAVDFYYSMDGENRVNAPKKLPPKP